MKLEDKLQQVAEATTLIETKISRLIAERDELNSRLAGIEPGLGELTPDQEAAIDQAVSRLFFLAA